MRRVFVAPGGHGSSFLNSVLRLTFLKLHVRPDYVFDSTQYTLDDCPSEEAIEKFPEEVRKIDMDSLHHDVTGSEGFNDFLRRIKRSFGLFLNDGEHETVAVVTHGAATAVAVAALLDGDPTLWRNYSFINCGVSELVLDPGPPYLSSYNEMF